MESSDEEPKFESYVGDLLNFMRYCKIWKADAFSPTKNLLVTFAVGLLLASDLAVILATLVDFENASKDLTSFAAYVGPLCLQCIGLTKWSYCIWKVDDITALLTTLGRCHRLSTRINKRDLGWKKYNEEMKTTRLHYLRFLYVWSWLCIYGVLHWCSNPIILEIKEDGFSRVTLMVDDNSTNARTRYLPYLGWRPWDVDNNFGYASLFLVQFTGGMCSVFGCIAYDVFHISLLMIVCAHLRYLNESLIDVEDGATSRTLGTSLDFETKLKHCVNHHAAILSFLNALEILVSPPMLAQCFETLFALCLVSLEASTIEVNTSLKSIIKLWSMLEYFLCVALQLFVYCYYSTEIQTLGLRIADSVYMSNWEHATWGDKSSDDRPAARRINFLIQMFLVRSQKGILLTGGPFYVLSLETFKSIVGLAMSNSLILRQVVDERA